MSTIPRLNDVLAGKGTAINTHHGNKHLRSMVELERPRFTNANTRAGKRQVANSIINEIEKLGGRFLMEDPNSSKRSDKGGVGKNITAQTNPDTSDGLVTDPFILAKVWVPLEKDKALSKVMHRLREKRTSVGQSVDQKQHSKDMEPQLDISRVDAADGMAPGAQYVRTNAISHYGEESKVAPNSNIEHGKQASQTNSTVDSIAHASATSTSLAEPHIPTMECVARAPVPGSIQGPPLNLKEWVRSMVEFPSPRDGYLISATNISWMLTKHLIQLIADESIMLRDITAEKVIILTDPTSSLLIQSAQFSPSTYPLLTRHDSWAPTFARAACFALGGILLELFSMGRADMTNYQNFSSQGQAVVPPAPKRRAVMGLLELFSTGQSDMTNYPHCTVREGQAVAPPAQKRKAVGSSILVKNLLNNLGMPLSICQLVCDLLDAISESQPTALGSLEDALFDLTQMKDQPLQFLFDRTCPLKALVDTCLFVNTDSHLFGREKEMESMMSARKRISDHVLVGGINPKSENNFLCELIFLSGYAGSGKTTLLDSLMRACNREEWIVLKLKFQKNDTPHMVIAKALDDFVGKWKLSSGDQNINPSMALTLDKIFEFILASIGNEGLWQLCELIPNMREAFPQITASAKSHRGLNEGSNVGNAHKRRKYLFEVIGQAMCSTGRPVLACFDDLQWSETFAMEILEDFIGNQADTTNIGKERCREGFLFVGTFRSNEVEENDFIIKTINSIEKHANVTKLTTGELGKDDIAKLLSAKLCLPPRYTNRLASLVLSKTRGNPFFVTQFLKSITENRMLEFSVGRRRWMWDCEVIDMLMISDEVAELLTTRFNKMAFPLCQTMKIVSCLGYQASSSTIDLLNLGHQVPFNMQDALHTAINEGFIEKAGPLFQFTHDIIRETIYDLIPVENRRLLHRCIGYSLLQFADNDPSIYLLAVDQINFYSKDFSVLDPEERSSIARINVTAAKFARDASSFEQARSYIDAGMQLLEKDSHWQTQYPLSLEIYELSASVSCMHGDTSTMSSCLNEIIANVKNFEDSLTSSGLVVKLLASLSKYDEAISNCLSVLSSLGEDISPDVSLPLVFNELAVIQTTLASITIEQVKSLPPMTDKTKLHIMKFLSIACMYSIYSKPLLLPLLSCSMVRLTIEHGFCDDSIVGLASAGFGLFTFSDDLKLGYRIGKVCDALVEESPNRHALRSRLCREIDAGAKCMVEPQHSIVPVFHDRYNSAMLTGDVESAMRCLVSHCLGCFHIGENLASLSKKFLACIELSKKYQQTAVVHVAMTNLRGCIHLTGRSEVAIGIKTYEELTQIASTTNNNHLQWRIFITQLTGHYYDRNWIKVVELSEKQPSSRFNRILASGRALYAGIASLNLARQTHQLKWRSIGEEAVKKFAKYSLASQWNYLDKFQLLQAELHYLDGQLESAEDAYKASIKSAHDHQFFHDEALACELYGIFCIENRMVDKGAEQLRISLDRYKQWGAMKKAEDLQLFIDVVDPSDLRKLKIKI